MTASGIFPMNEAVCVSRGQGEQKGGFRDLHVTLVAPLRSNSEYSHPSHSCPHPRLCMRPSSHAVAQPCEPVGRHRQGGGPESSTLRGLFGRADAQAEHLNIQSLTESERGDQVYCLPVCLQTQLPRSSSSDMADAKAAANVARRQIERSPAAPETTWPEPTKVPSGQSQPGAVEFP